MENEIELKIMLRTETIPAILDWLSGFSSLKQGRDQLANCYYDTTDLFFARQKMGLRVRSQNHRHELTLKTAGQIVGGLHIRPEYNLSLRNSQPDFTALVQHFQLPFPPIDTLQPTFSTDFERQYWLITYQDAQIEIALDQGWVENSVAKEAICELECELKQGGMEALFAFLDTMPKLDGMWLSSLSKAQRGYLVGNSAEIAKNIQHLTACNWHTTSQIEKYQLEQQLVDFIRLTEDRTLIALYNQLNPTQPFEYIEYFYSQAYLVQNLALMRSLTLS